jgi:hypothetical protein
MDKNEIIDNNNFDNDNKYSFIVWNGNYYELTCGYNVKAGQILYIVNQYALPSKLNNK